MKQPVWLRSAEGGAGELADEQRDDHGGGTAEPDSGHRTDPLGRARGRRPPTRGRAGPPTAAVKTSAERPSSGATRNATSGTRPPSVNAASDASDACTGRAAVSSVRPSSSRACAASASRSVSWRATSIASSGSMPRASQICGQLAQLGHRVLLRAPGARSAGRPLDVALARHRHVLAQRHRQRAGRQARDPRRAHRAVRGPGSGHTDDEARGGHHAVVGAEHRGPQPARPVRPVGFGVRVRHVVVRGRVVDHRPQACHR